MAKKNKKKTGQNYLDFVPVLNAQYPFQTDEQGHVTILVENKGVFHRMAQHLWKKPKISYIHLDEMGNFIWPFLDGTHTVYEIAGLVHEQFGEKAEPLYDRLVQYLKNLEHYGFILLKK